MGDLRSAFLAEILSAPDDDVPRLIFADWLEEEGEPRGEFIRVQIELHQLGDLDPRSIDLADRSRELLAQYSEVWAQELNQDVRKSVYQRGFIETITVRARAFLKDGDQLFRAAPVRWLRFNYVKGVGTVLAECPALQHIRYLDLMDLKIPSEELESILQSPWLSELRG